MRPINIRAYSQTPKNISTPKYSNFAFSQFSTSKNTSHFSYRYQPFQLHKRFLTNDVPQTITTILPTENNINNETNVTKTVAPTTDANTTTTTTTATTENIVNQESTEVLSPEVSAERLNEILESFKIGTENAVETVAAKSGYWFDPIIEACETCIVTIHNVTGLPWWLSLTAAGVTMRIATLPLNIIAVRNSSMLAKIRNTIQQIQTSKSQLPPNATAAERSERMQIIRQEVKEVSKKHGVSNWKIFLPMFIQIPIMISFYTAIRRMCLDHPEFATGGAFWFQNLTESDPIYLLPIMTGLIFLSTSEIQRWINVSNGIELNKLSELMQKVFRGIFFIMIPLTSLLHVGVHFYWIGTGTIGAILPLMWRNKTVQKILNLPSNAGLQGMPKILPKPDVVFQKPPKPSRDGKKE